MSDFPSYAEIRDVARSEMLARNAQLTVDAIDRDGTDANVLVAAMAAIGDEVVGQLSRVEASLLLGAARGTDLDRVAFDRYGILRKPATAAVGSVSFTTPTNTLGAFSIPSGIRLQSADGIQFLTTESATFPIASMGPIVVAVRATTAGLASQAKANTIVSLADTISGAPANLAVTNPLATSGAAEAEIDDDLRSRALAFFLTARRGTAGAIQQAALAVAGVKTATVIEVIDASSRAARAVELIVTDAFTESLAQLAVVPPSYQTQSQALATAVFAGLDDARAAGIFVDVVVAKVVMQPVILALSFQAGTDVNRLALQARALTVANINSLSPGQPMRVADLASSLRSLPGLIVSGTEILSPAGDVVPTPLEVIRSTMGLVSAATVQPDRRLAGTANSDAV